MGMMEWGSSYFDTVQPAIQKDRDAGLSVDEISKKYSVSKSVVYRRTKKPRKGKVNGKTDLVGRQEN
jgi:transposase